MTDQTPAQHAWLVTRGQYADTTAIAALANREEARHFADQWTLDNLDMVQGEDDRATVAARLPFYPEGAWHAERDAAERAAGRQHWRDTVAQPDAPAPQPTPATPGTRPLTRGELRELVVDINFATGHAGSTPDKVQQFLPLFLAAIGVEVEPEPTPAPAVDADGPECFETRYSERGDCDGPLEVVGQRYTGLGLPQAAAVVMCASHARQARVAGEVEWTPPGANRRVTGGGYTR
jgi:hypothetical protein